MTEEEKSKRLTKTKSDKTIKTEKADDGLKLYVNDFEKYFTVQMLHGKNIRLSDLKGKVALLDLWAS